MGSSSHYSRSVLADTLLHATGDKTIQPNPTQPTRQRLPSLRTRTTRRRSWKGRHVSRTNLCIEWKGHLVRSNKKIRLVWSTRIPTNGSPNCVVKLSSQSLVDPAVLTPVLIPLGQSFQLMRNIVGSLGILKTDTSNIKIENSTPRSRNRNLSSLTMKSHHFFEDLRGNAMISVAIKNHRHYQPLKIATFLHNAKPLGRTSTRNSSTTASNKRYDTSAESIVEK